MLKPFYTNSEMESLFRSRNLEYDSPYSLDQLIEKTKDLNNLDIRFPSIDEQIETNSSLNIAVIGNSGKLLKQEYGQLIDSHDIIIRCNLARTQGYEKFVGTKTNFRVIAGKSFWRDLSQNFSAYNKDFLINLENEHFLIKAEPLYNAIQGVIKNYNTKSKISYIRQEFINDIEQRTNIQDISVGLTAIELAMQWSDKVSIFGFGFFEEDWDSRHYFESIKPYQIGHNPTHEKKYINSLLERRIIKKY